MFCKKVYVSYLRLIDEPSNKPDDKTKMLNHNLHLLTGAGHKQIFLVVEYKQPARIFKCWIVKSIYYAIYWIAIYPVDSAMKHLHECPLGMLCMGVAQDLLVVYSSFKYWLHSIDCLFNLLMPKCLKSLQKYWQYPDLDFLYQEHEYEHESTLVTTFSQTSMKF